MANMKHTIFFDLGNVLLFFDMDKMYRQVADLCSLELPEVATLMQVLIDPYERGLIDTKKVHADFAQLSHKKNLDYHLLRHAVCDIFKPNDAVIDIAVELKKKGCKLFILSNTCEAHFEFALSQFDFFKLFDGFILSYKVGARKPEKKIFESALVEAQCSREHCFYTDDIPEFVHAAKSLQIDAENYTTPKALKTHLHQRNIL